MSSSWWPIWFDGKSAGVVVGLVIVFLVIVDRFEDSLKNNGRRIGRLEQTIAALISATVHREAAMLS